MEYYNTFCNRMNESRKRNLLLDFTLYNDLGDERSGHMVIMSISCPPIRDMANSDNRRFLLSGVSAEAMEKLLNFMYIGELEITDDTVECIMTGALRLEIAEVREACLDYMNINQDPRELSKSRRHG